jgi:Uma2 family endonuclease
MSSAAPEKRWTVEEYLAFEQESAVRHEYFYGEIFAIVGGGENHANIITSTQFCLYGQLDQKHCRVFASEMRVKISRRVYTYPDMVAVCGERHFEESLPATLLNPTY